MMNARQRSLEIGSGSGTLFVDDLDLGIVHLIYIEDVGQEKNREASQQAKYEASGHRNLDGQHPGNNSTDSTANYIGDQTHALFPHHKLCKQSDKNAQCK